MRIPGGGYEEITCSLSLSFICADPRLIRVIRVQCSSGRRNPAVIEQSLLSLTARAP